MPSDEDLWRARMENEWADTKAAAKRAEAAEARVQALKEINRSVREDRRQAEARIAELERELASALEDGWVPLFRFDQLRARAERLAEAAERHSHCWDATTHRQLREALAAFRSTEPQAEAECTCGDRGDYTVGPCEVCDAAIAAESEPHPTQDEQDAETEGDGYRAVRDLRAVESEPHPDTVRLDWLESQHPRLWPCVLMEWDREEFMGLNYAMEGHEPEGDHRFVLADTLREAIDAAREGEEWT